MKAVERRGHTLRIVRRIRTSFIQPVPVGFRLPHAPLGHRSHPFAFEIPHKSIVLVIHQIPRAIADLSAEPAGRARDPAANSGTSSAPENTTSPSSVFTHSSHKMPSSSSRQTPIQRRLQAVEPEASSSSSRFSSRASTAESAVASGSANNCIVSRPTTSRFGSLPCRRRAKRLQKTHDCRQQKSRTYHKRGYFSERYAKNEDRTSPVAKTTTSAPRQRIMPPKVRRPKR